MTLKSMVIWGWLTIGISQALANPQVTLLAERPATYTVQANDTLWSIAEHFLVAPWQWPQLFKRGSQLTSPHDIYPGDVIQLVTSDSTPYWDIVSRASQVEAKSLRREKIQPQIRVLPAKKPIPSIPMEVIRPFFSQHQIITSGALDKAPEVLAIDEEHLLLGPGMRFYSQQPNVAVGDRFTLQRPGTQLIAPHSQTQLGQLVEILGHATVQQVGPVNSLILNQSYQEIKVGDKLVPLKVNLADFDPYFTPQLPQTDPHGQVLTLFNDLAQASQYQVVALTGGKVQRQIGDVLGIYQLNSVALPTAQNKQQSQVILPKLKVGTMMVFQVFEHSSLALVTQALRTIYLHDEVGSP